MRSNLLRLCAVLALLASIGFHPASAAILRVDCAGGPFLTIQSAVFAAVSGDTILVNNCTYNENVVISGFSRLHLVAASQGYFGAREEGVGLPVPPAPPVIVTGGGLPGPCFAIDTSSDIDIVGFWMRGCAGGGVRITGSDDILIEGNRLQSNGGIGIHAIGTVRGIYTGNIVALSSAQGIVLEDTIVNTVADNFVYRNLAEGVLTGAGIQNRIVNNDIRLSGNEGIFAAGNELRIEKNSVTGNGGINQVFIDTSGFLVDLVGNNVGGAGITDTGAGTDMMDNF